MPSAVAKFTAIVSVEGADRLTVNVVFEVPLLPSSTLTSLIEIDGCGSLSMIVPMPWLSEEAAQVITGKSISEETTTAAADAAVQAAKPLSQNTYKVQLARVAVKRAILKAGGAA